MLKAKIEELRKKIDSIDKDILNLILERRDCAVEIGILKDKQLPSDDSKQISPYDAKREEEIISKLKLLYSSLPQNGIEAIYREIISLCRNEAHNTTICILEGTKPIYHSALKLLGRSCAYKNCKGKEDFIESLKTSEFNLGLVSEPLPSDLVETLENIGYKKYKSMLPSIEGNIQNLEAFIFTRI